MSDKILVLNSGSTSIKYKFFDLETLDFIADGNYQNVTDRGGTLKNILRDIGDLRDIVAVGHRVVHGGLDYTEPTLLDQETIKKIEIKYNPLAPLHNPANLAGVRACQQYLEGVNNYAVFDTSFYKNLPEESRLYAIPPEIARENLYCRFGFHGISHKYIIGQVSQKLKKSANKLKIISCHLGGGASITAIKHGSPLDTSMGFTPLEGLMMMTRCGDIDPGVILDMARKYGVDEVEKILNKKSGIYGVSGSKDYLEVLKGKNLGKPDYTRAFKMFVYRIKKYIGAYYAVLDGCDALVFTGMIGSGRPETREEVLKDIKFIKKTKVLAITTDEEYQIASEIKEFLNK